MDLLTQAERLIKEIVGISNRQYSFEKCFEKILFILIQKTKSKCGCILAEFENTNSLIHGSDAENCYHFDSLFEFFSKPERRDAFPKNRKYFLISELESLSDYSFGKHVDEGVVFPISDQNGSYGFICLYGSTVDEKQLLLNELIGDSVMCFIVKIYIEKRYSLLEKYYLAETEITDLISANKNLNKIPRIILNKLDLFSVTLLSYDPGLCCVDVVTSDSRFPADIRKTIKNLHIDLRSDPIMNNILLGLDTPAVVDSETVSRFLSVGDNSSFLENIAGTLQNLGIGDLLVSPSLDSSDGKKFFLVAIKKKSRRFMKSQIALVKKLAKIATLIVEKELSESLNFQKANRIDIAEKISRRIIDDSDVNIEANYIRQELRLHTCMVFLINRLENKFRSEGFSSKISKSRSKIIETIEIKLESIFGAGYSQSELHQIRIVKIGEYIKSIENFGNNNPGLLSLLKGYKDHNVVQVPLFDSYRRLQGFLLFVKEPDQHIQQSEVELVKELSSKIANAFEIRKNIYFDSLTELPNTKRLRPLIVEKLISAEAFSLVICKIINIKEIVIARGDDTVDKCMITVTTKIKNLLLGQTSNILLGRNSGEASFILIHPSISTSELEEFSQELKDCITETIKVNGNSINLYTNIGICHSSDIWDTDTVFNYSKLAIQAIADQRNGLCIFDSRMQMEYLQEQRLEGDIREALGAGNFIAHYQPKVRCDGCIVGYEALVRWRRKDKLELPNNFIFKIEKMGMMRSLFSIVFEYICKDLHCSSKFNNVSINISPSQLVEREQFLDSISSIISRHAIDPKIITFEFVETAMLNSDYFTTIKRLKEIGFRLSIDDFGTGYARYKTLIDLFNQGFVNELKIDKVFVDDIESTGNQNFIRSISHLAKEFNIAVVVEGVETIQQFSRIKSIDSDILIQGWLVSKALTLEEVENINDQKIASTLMKSQEIPA